MKRLAAKAALEHGARAALHILPSQAKSGQGRRISCWRKLSCGLRAPECTRFRTAALRLRADSSDGRPFVPTGWHPIQAFARVLEKWEPVPLRGDAESLNSAHRLRRSDEAAYAGGLK